MGGQAELKEFCRRRFEDDSQTKSCSSPIKKEEGFISVLIILIITLLAFIGIEGFSLVQAQSKYIRQEADKVKCVYLAEGGLEWARASLIINPQWSGGTRLYSDGSVKIDVALNEEKFVVIAEAQSGTARREIKVLLEPEVRMNIVRYEERHD